MFQGPEALAFRDGYLFTGILGGDIVRLDLKSPGFPDKTVWQIVAKTGSRDGTLCDGTEHDEANCGRPLGMAFLPDGQLLVCDAIYGLLRVDVNTGKSEVLVSQGRKM